MVLDRISTAAWILAVLCMALSLLSGTFPALAGAATGSVISLGNFWLLRKSLGFLGNGLEVQKAFRASGKKAGKVALKPAVLFVVKSLALYGSMALVIRYVPLDFLWFAAGLSVIVGAILAEAAILALRGSK